MKYALISAVNLAILLVGIALGVVLAPHIEKKASANSQQTASQQQPSNPPSDLVRAVKTTPIQPQMTAANIGVFLILSHHIQTDELVVNGYDLLKLQNSELQLLSRFVPPGEIQKLINDSKANEFFTVASSAPESPKPSPK